MEKATDNLILEEYRKIKDFFDKFRALKGEKKEARLTLDIESIRKNLRKSLAAKQFKNDNFSGYL